MAHRRKPYFAAGKSMGAASPHRVGHDSSNREPNWLFSGSPLHPLGRQETRHTLEKVKPPCCCACSRIPSNAREAAR